MAAVIKYDRLRSQLAMTGLSKSNPTLYQVIDQLIDLAMRSLVESANNTTVIADDVTGVAADLGIVKNSDFLTFSDESSLLPNSRELIAGTGVTFDDLTPNQRIINTSGGGAVWSVLTDGDVIEPELIFAGGDVIMTHIP